MTNGTQMLLFMTTYNIIILRLERRLHMFNEEASYVKKKCFVHYIKLK